MRTGMKNPDLEEPRPGREAKVGRNSAHVTIRKMLGDDDEEDA